MATKIPAEKCEETTEVHRHTAGSFTISLRIHTIVRTGGPKPPEHALLVSLTVLENGDEVVKIIEERSKNQDVIRMTFREEGKQVESLFRTSTALNRRDDQMCDKRTMDMTSTIVLRTKEERVKECLHLYTQRVLGLSTTQVGTGDHQPLPLFGWWKPAGINQAATDAVLKFIRPDGVPAFVL
jgi:hypothetical protein